MLDVFAGGEGAIRTSDGARLFYRIAGRGKETFLFMHGWGGESSGSFWTPLLRNLRSPDSQFVLADLRGHGRSGPCHSGFTTERFAEDMFELADHLAAREFILVGYSMSGRWAQWMSLSRPDRVLGQILLGPAPASAMPLSPELADNWIRSVSTRDGYHRFETQFTKNGLPEEALDDCYGAVTRAPELSLRETLRMCAQPGFEDKLSSVRVPTLVVGGKHDPIMTPEYLDNEIVAKIPGARLALLDCGHNLPLEMPTETAAIIEGFVAGLAR